MSAQHDETLKEIESSSLVSTNGEGLMIPELETPSTVIEEAESTPAV